MAKPPTPVPSAINSVREQLKWIEENTPDEEDFALWQRLTAGFLDAIPRPGPKQPTLEEIAMDLDSPCFKTRQGLTSMAKQLRSYCQALQQHAEAVPAPPEPEHMHALFRAWWDSVGPSLPQSHHDFHGELARLAFIAGWQSVQATPELDTTLVDGEWLKKMGGVFHGETNRWFLQVTIRGSAYSSIMFSDAFTVWALRGNGIVLGVPPGGIQRWQVLWLLRVLQADPARQYEDR